MDAREVSQLSGVCQQQINNPATEHEPGLIDFVANRKFRVSVVQVCGWNSGRLRLRKGWFYVNRRAREPVGS